MNTVTFSLPDDQFQFVEGEMAAGGFASPGEYFAHLIDEERRAFAELEAKLLEGIEGPFTPFDFDDIRRRGYEALKQKREGQVIPSEADAS